MGKIVCLLSGLLLLGGCMDLGGPWSDNGGTSQQGNAIVAGSVSHEDGSEAAYAKVQLVPGDFKAWEGGTLPDSLVTMTDWAGTFIFGGVDTGTYTFEVVHFETGGRLLKQGIVISEDTVKITDNTLIPPGTLKVYLPEGISKAGGSVYIPHTSLYADVTAEALAEGMVVLPAPAGDYEVMYFTSGKGGQPLTLNDGFSVSPGAVTGISPYHTWTQSAKITINTSSTGADVDGDVYDYPLLVRLDSSILSPPWGAGGGKDIRFTNANGKPLAFQIERWEPGRQAAEIWVKVDTIYGGSSNQHILMYWGMDDPGLTPASNGPEVFDVSLGFKGVWHMGDDPAVIMDDSVRAIKDASWCGCHGTYYGTMTADDRVEGAVGYAFDFSGGLEYFSFPNAAVLDIAEGLTLEIWIKAAEFAGDSTGYEWMYKGNNYAYGLKLDSIGRVVFAFEDPYSLEDRLYITSQPAVELNQWTSVAARFLGSSFSLHVNGVRQDMEVLSDSLYVRSSPFFDGGIDEVRLSDRAFSSSWVRLNYEMQKAGSR